jgi:hypothetical protein
MFKLLLAYQWWRVRQYFRTKRGAKMATAGLFAAVFVGVGAGIYAFFHEGFLYIGREPYYRDAFTLYVYELYLLIIFFLALMGGAASMVFSLFRTKSDNWIIGSPAYRILPAHVLLKIFLQTIWPLLLIVLPGLLAAHTVYGLTPAKIIIAVVAIAVWLLSLTMALFAAIIFLAVMLRTLEKIIPTGILRLNFLAVMLGLSILLAAFFIGRNLAQADLGDLFRIGEFNRTAVDAAVIAKEFTWLPSHPAAQFIFALVEDNSGGALKSGGWLAAMFAAAIALWFWARVYFLPVWQRLEEGGYVAGRAQNRKKYSSAFFRRGPMRAVYEKEYIVAARSWRNVAWFFFLFLLWLMQAGANMVLGRFLSADRPDIAAMPVMAVSFQVATAAFFLSALVLRFVFPAFSAERRTAWILAVAPVSFRKIFWAKYLFYSPLFLALGLMVNYLNAGILGLPLAWFLAGYSILTAASIFIITFGFFLGAVFPNFSTDDPSALSTTLPGLAFIVGALSYGAAGSYVLYYAAQTGRTGAIWGYLLLAAVLSAAMLKIAPRKLEQMDFIKSN